MEWQTKVDIPIIKNGIRYSDKMIFMGSCFANEIGSIMKDLRFDISVNPFGVLFNPITICKSIESMLNNNFLQEEDVVQNGDRFFSFRHSSDYSSDSKEDLLKSLNNKLLNESEALHSSNWIIISLGTSWAYKYINTGKIVSNCHKLPSRLFERENLSINEIVESFVPLIESLADKRWIFTVSPIRHWKDGAHGNQLSKATLLLATDQLCKKFSNVHYYPAYELFMDELRDYRYYAKDMIHPSEPAIEYVWSKFKESYIDQLEWSKIDNVAKLNTMYNHRPLFPNSRMYNDFLKKREDFEKKIFGK